MQTESNEWCKLLGLAADATPLEICAEFEKLAVALAPLDFDKLPFYAMPTSSLPPKFIQAQRDCMGWYHSLLFHWIRPCLPEYRGIGPAVVVVSEIEPAQRKQIVREIERICRDRGRELPSDESIDSVFDELVSLESLCGILVHELEHAIDGLAAGEWYDAVVAYRGGAARPVFETMIERETARTEPLPPQLDCHGLRFTRIVCHLDFRLRQAGVRSSRFSCAGKKYGIADYDTCYAALGDEMAMYAATSFESILALPMPPDFAACALELEAVTVG